MVVCFFVVVGSSQETVLGRIHCKISGFETKNNRSPSRSWQNLGQFGSFSRFSAGNRGVVPRLWLHPQKRVRIWPTLPASLSEVNPGAGYSTHLVLSILNAWLFDCWSVASYTNIVISDNVIRCNVFQSCLRNPHQPEFAHLWSYGPETREIFWSIDSINCLSPRHQTYPMCYEFCWWLTNSTKQACHTPLIRLGCPLQVQEMR